MDAQHDALSKLDIYLDGELPTGEMQAMDAHLRACPECAAEVVARLSLRRNMQAAGKRFAPRVEFREQVRKRIVTKPRALWARGWILATALAMVLVGVGLVVSYVEQQRRQEARVFGEITDLHVAALASANPVDVVSTDRHTVKPWFQGKIPFTFALPELQNTEFTLVGGRVTYLGQSPGAQLIYQVRKHQISVFIFQEKNLERVSSTGPRELKEMSFTVESWSKDGLRYVAVGDAPGQDLDRLAQLLKSAS
jgi:anti-sigma factor RsiW